MLGFPGIPSVKTTVALQAHAAVQGESVNGFINRAISEAMERDGLEGSQEAAEKRKGPGKGVANHHPLNDEGGAQNAPPSRCLRFGDTTVSKKPQTDSKKP